MVIKILSKGYEWSSYKNSYEMGKDAIIISQRKVRKPGFQDFKPKMVEVTAALENNKIDKNSKYKKNDDIDINESINSIKKLMKDKTKELNKSSENKRKK